ncbi:MAG: DUF502 domain-containing protein [Armatimonadota bacterium]|nr:DUF502 domain-containing protein [Armatimonadota bacterium]MDR7451261.1 DUF502 domain-containing protein [Armatimonadota bacterium]MDR7466836.1 DUF502 domain-containing protein [Armatimonadota bacterium]MDR7492691.1 DUF502 domain-containing protein [Armatimonadota bacterium]MDR7499620.1 DUF502 domain-containing protein [Armatimonadota bacterium]
MRARLQRYFIAGLIVFLPIAVTFSIIAWLFAVVDGLLGRLLPPLIGHQIPGLGLVTSIVVIFVIGAMATNVFGRRIVAFFDRLMLRLPLARSIYSATKSISDTIFLQRRAAFQRAVLVEWPRPGMFTIGFVTGEIRGLPGPTQRGFNVFVVTTPNPTTGFLVFVPETEVTPLEMSVEDALKIVISGGIVSPALMPRIGGASGSPTVREGV